jgi:protein-L-isoaspartate(D-aspartate) O-methyltransferase
VSAAPAWAGWLERYVDDLVARGHVRTDRVARAFRRVPRHLCIAAYHDRGRWVEVAQADDAAIPEDVLAHVYSDAALVTALHDDRPVHTATAPPVMAEMLEALELQAGERVLEIGTGTGYNAALLADITGTDVVTVERSAEVAEAAAASLRRLGEDRVTVVTADGFDGHAAAGPYDRVIATVAAPGVAEPWMDQLALDGLVVAPVEVAGCHPVLRVERSRPFTAAGLGVWWTDIATGGGALAHRAQRAGPAAPAESGENVEHVEHVERHDRLALAMPDPGSRRPGSTRTVRSFVPALDAAAHGGLCAYVTVADRRVTAFESPHLGADPGTGACVAHGRRGAVAVVGRTGITAGGPARFAEEIGGLADRWRRAGSPTFAEWSCRLTLERRPAGRFWRAHGWTVAGAPLRLGGPRPRPLGGTRRARGSDPATLADAVLAWLADAAVEASTVGLRSVARRQVGDLATGAASNRGEPHDLRIGQAFDTLADAAEERDGAAPTGATTTVGAVAEAPGVPPWAATIAGHVVASLVRSPANHPLLLAGRVLRITGRSLEAELEQRRAAARRAGAGSLPGLPARALLATDTFGEELRSMLTEGLQAEVRLLVLRAPSEQRVAWDRFIAPDRVPDPAYEAARTARPAPAGARSSSRGHRKSRRP